MPRVLSSGIWTTPTPVACGLNLVGSATTGDPSIIYWDPSLFPGPVPTTVFPSRNTQAIWGKPTYNYYQGDYVYTWRSKIDATYDGAGTNHFHDYVSTQQLWTWNVTNRTAPITVQEDDLVVDASGASAALWSGDVALVRDSLFAISFGQIPWQQATLSVFDTSTPSSPSVVSSTALSLSSNEFPYNVHAFTVSGSDYCVILVNTGTSYMQVYDTAGNLQSTTTMNYPVRYEGQMIDTTLYVGTYENFPYLECWDLSNPASPTQLGYYDPSADDILGVGASGTTAFGQFVFNGAGENRLHAVDFSTPATPSLYSYIVENPYGKLVSEPNHVQMLGSIVVHKIDTTDPSNMSDCPNNGQAYYSVGQEVWNTLYIGYVSGDSTAGDGYLYGWGQDEVLIPSTTYSFDGHLAVWQIT